MNAQSDISDILGKMTSGPLVAGTNKVGEVLKHFASAGLERKTCADDRHLGRSVSTLKRYACRLNLKFPDYCPRHLKPKKAKKRA
jgi:hypothetical protein